MYVKPEEVVSPQANWTLIGVLNKSCAGEAVYAVGTWDDELRIAIRWNGYKGKPKGTPISSSYPIWTMFPKEDGGRIVEALGFTDRLLKIVAEQHAKLNR